MSKKKFIYSSIATVAIALAFLVAVPQAFGCEGCISENYQKPKTKPCDPNQPKEQDQKQTQDQSQKQSQNQSQKVAQSSSSNSSSNSSSSSSAKTNTSVDVNQTSKTVVKVEVKVKDDHKDKDHKSKSKSKKVVANKTLPATGSDALGLVGIGMASLASVAGVKRYAFKK